MSNVVISVPHGICSSGGGKLCDSKANVLASEMKKLLHPLDVKVHVYDQDHVTWMGSYDARSTDYRKSLLREAKNTTLHIDIHSFDPDYHSDWRDKEIIIAISGHQDGNASDLINYLSNTDVKAEIVSNRSDIGMQMEENNITTLTLYVNDRLDKAEIGYLARILTNWILS